MIMMINLDISVNDLIRQQFQHSNNLQHMKQFTSNVKFHHLRRNPQNHALIQTNWRENRWICAIEPSNSLTQIVERTPLNNSMRTNVR